MGACLLQLPPNVLADALLVFMSPVPASEGTFCSRHVGSCPHSPGLPCTQLSCVSCSRNPKLVHGLQHLQQTLKNQVRETFQVAVFERTACLAGPSAWQLFVGQAAGSQGTTAALQPAWSKAGSSSG